MNIKNKIRQFGYIGAILLLTQLTTACTHFHTKDSRTTTPHDYSKFGGIKAVNGKLILVDKNGVQLQPTKVNFPIKDVKEIEKINVHTIISIQIRGSHYCLVEFGNEYYRFDLPHDPLINCPF